MKFTVLILLFPPLLCISCATQTKKFDHSPTSPFANFSERTLEAKVLYYTNIERAKYGLKSVTTHSGLANIARRHSDFTAKNEGKFGIHNTSVTHMGFSGRSRLARTRYNIGSLAENVHTTWSTSGNLANRIVQGWMNSPKHRKTMLGKSYTYCGIGIRQKGKGTFSTMLMATPENRLPKFIGPQGW